MLHRVPLLGVVAVLAVLGGLYYLPSPAAFFLSALGVILFPGLAIGSLLGDRSSDPADLPENLISSFVIGTFVVTAAGLAGIILQVRLQALMLALALGYTGLIILLIAWRTRTGRRQAAMASSAPERTAVGVYCIIFTLAIGAALLTLLTPRDFDDWYYLAYIKDYVVGKPLGAEDALFDMGNPAPPRIWFGGAWWVLEAILSKASGVDPVDCRQVYMPVLVLPFAVLALFTLARSVFRSASVGLLAVCLQVLFYLSSAFPQKSVGWFFLCRIAQDKAVSFFVIAPFAAALGLRFIQRQTDQDNRYRRTRYSLY
jgi:hypothetical protein